MKHTLAKLVGDFSNNMIVTMGMIATCEKFDLHVVGSAQHFFEPQGFTVVMLLAESHFSVHTFPELNEAYVDIFCCNPETDVEGAVRFFAEHQDAVIEDIKNVIR
jgi:S-adenosylmethionine decarboxylase